MSKELTAEYVRSILDYDPETGVFRWKVRADNNKWSSRFSGTPAGTYLDSGHLKIKIYGKKYYGHILAWLIVTGSWPVGSIDHKDVDASNNSFNNLRLATRAQNARNRFRFKNNQSGFKGVVSTGSRWMARITIDQKLIYLGSCDTPEEAARLYDEAAKEAFGEFARLNF